MKKTISVLLLLSIALFCLAGCASKKDLDRDDDIKASLTATTTTVVTTKTEDVQTTAEQEKYVSGYATSTNWTSSYLNLRYDVPYGWKMSDPLMLARVNNMYYDEGKGQYEEMIAQKRNNNGAMEKQVYMVALDLSINFPNMTIDEIIQEDIKNTEQQMKNLSTNGVEMKCNIDDPKQYLLCGMDFTMVHLETDKYFNGTYTGTTYGWCLYRIAGDSVVMISCSTPSGSDTLEYMLAGFSKLY
ncbi:MAG: hypothetical protein K6C14_06280 [Eubacterium sp.]|nr:hypothetical protein [Eubacterium sp.]